MMLYELDDTEKAALMEAVVDRARADLNDGKPLTEMAVQMSSCDGCGESKPRAGFRSISAYGCEGSFCHDCRHGKNCDCGADDE